MRPHRRPRTLLVPVTGERQLYDRRTDPDELHNIVFTADPSSFRTSLSSCRP